MNRVCSSAAKLSYKKVTHVIFDLDGLLLDTEHLYTKAVQNIVGKFGKTYGYSVKVQVMGMTGVEAAKTIVKLLDLPLSWEEYYELAKEQYNIIMPDAELLPGAERLVKHLHSNQIPIAVATSSGQDTYKLKTKKHQELFSLFSHVVTGGSDPEVKHGKPSPDIFLICASRFKDHPSPEKCLVLEDAPNGVDAAISAGMQVVMVPDKQTDEKLCQHATLKLNSLEEMKPELFGLPPFSTFLFYFIT